MRYCHYIKGNKKCETPHRAIWFALHIKTRLLADGSKQSYYESGTMARGKRIDGSDKWRISYADFYSVDQFWRLVDDFAKDKTRTWLICRNSSLTISLLQMFTTADAYGWSLTFAVIECPPCIIRWKKEKKSLSLFDMQNVWRTPLSDTSIGKQEPVSVEQNDLAELLHEISETEKRVQRMVTTCLDWWNFLVSNDLGGFSPTIGAQSFRVWRHKFMTDKILIDLHDDALALSRRGLYGGRCECFYIGEVVGKFWQLDINSSYPFAMRNMRVPVKLVGRTEHAVVYDLHKWTDEYVVVADVDVLIDQPSLPVHADNGLIFPIGKFRTVLCGAELTHAMTFGVVTKVYDAAVYEWRYAFKTFVDAIWERRCQANAHSEYDDADKWKMILNSFFGKWCQSGGQWEKVEETDDMSVKSWVDIEYDTKVIHEFRQFGGIIQERGHEKESSESHPAIAACTTAQARINLWHYIADAGADNVYYVDTDSLLVNDVGFRRLYKSIQPGKIGSLKIVGEYNNIRINSAKNYSVGDTRRHSGVKQDGIYVDSRTVDQTSIHSLAGAIAQGKEGDVTEYRVRKTFDSKYTKGIVGADGRVSPLELGNAY